MSVLLTNSTTERKKRAISLDLARGAMLLLIVLAHAPLYLYNSEPGIMQRAESINFFDQVVNLFGMFFIDNRARPMFAILLGYGLVLSFNSQISKGKSEKDAIKSNTTTFLVFDFIWDHIGSLHWRSRYFNGIWFSWASC